MHEITIDSDLSALSRKNIVKASYLVAVSAILYGFLGYLGTRILDEKVTIPTMLFWRFIIAGVWMLIFVGYKQRKNRTATLNKRVLLLTFLLGAGGYAGSSAFFFMASRTTGTGMAMVIFFSYPIAISILNWIFHRKKLSLMTVLVLFAMTVGLVLLQGSLHSPFNIAGIGFGVLAALSYALYVVGSKRFSTVKIDSNLLSMMVCFGSALLFLVIALMTQSFALPSSLSSCVYLAALGILVTAIPIQLMLEGLKQISSMRASIISVLEPIVTVVVGIILLNESVSHVQIVGALLIMISAIVVQFQKEL